MNSVVEHLRSYLSQLQDDLVEVDGEVEQARENLGRRLSNQVNISRWIEETEQAIALLTSGKTE